MAPKKEKAQKLSYGEFMNNGTGGGSWADEVEDSYESGSQPLPAYERKTYGGGDRGGSSYGGGGGGGDRFEGYHRREQVVLPIPENGPYLAHLGNLPYDIVSEDITNFLQDCDITSVRLIEDRETNRPKGFGYAEFANVDGLKKALSMDGESFLNRNIKIRVAEPPKDRSGNDQTRDFGDWSRKGPLPDLPSRGGAGGFDRRGPSDFGERRGPPRERDAPADDGKVRDFGNWERKGPLSPLPQQERAPGSRDGSRPRMNDRTESTRSDRRGSPAAWGEGRQDGSRPPRREFSDRPERPERVPTAADQDNQWRSKMRPDAPVKSPGQSRSGSEAPSSPAPAAAPLASRPKLNLAKRTVSEAPDVTSPALPSAGGDSKANPFGAARPIDTAAREREIEEKRVTAEKDKKEADAKAKEDARQAKEAEAAKAAAAKEEAAKAEAEKQEKGDDAEKENKQEAGEGEDADEQTKGSQQPRTPREDVQNFKSRASESGNWRTASGEQRGGRGGQVPSGPRRGSGAPGRGGRHDGPRPARNGGPAPVNQTQPPQAGGEDVSPQKTGPDADGWETVTAPVKGRRTQRGGRGAAS